MPRFVDMPHDWTIPASRSETVISKRGFDVGERDDLAPCIGIAVVMCAEAIVVCFALMVWTLFWVAL